MKWWKSIEKCPHHALAISPFSEFSKKYNRKQSRRGNKVGKVHT
jgi:hypothetical protein